MITRSIKSDIIDAGYEDTPKRSGKIGHPEHFDATFFGVNPKQATFMDPRHRVFLETAYECIVDAGYNPKELRGTKTGIFILQDLQHFIQK